MSDFVTTSSFLGVGKRSAWQSWQAYPEVTEAFVSLAKDPFQLLQADSACFRMLERFVVVLYDRTSSLSSVNEARRDPFCHKNQAMERLPPIQRSMQLMTWHWTSSHVLNSGELPGVDDIKKKKYNLTVHSIELSSYVVAFR